MDQNTTINLIKRVIINYKKLPKVSVTLPKTRVRLSDLKTFWESQHLHGRITLVEDKKKLSYFLQDDFLPSSLPRMLNKAANHFQEAISNFVKMENLYATVVLNLPFATKRNHPR
jgi:hypothetical protein